MHGFSCASFAIATKGDRSIDQKLKEKRKKKILACLSDVKEHWKRLHLNTFSEEVEEDHHDVLHSKNCNCLVYSLKLLAAICTIPRVFRTII